MTYGTQTLETSTLSRPILGNEGDARSYFTQGGFPAGLDNSLKIIATSGTGAAFTGMSRADQIAVLNNLQELSEMEQNLIEQGVPQDQISQNLGNHARTQMGLTNVTNNDLDQLMLGYNRSNMGINERGDELVPLNPEQIAARNEQRIQNFVDGIDNTLPIGESVPKEVIESFASKYNLSVAKIQAELEDRNIPVDNRHTIPGQDLMKTGLALESVSMIPPMG